MLRRARVFAIGLLCTSWSPWLVAGDNELGSCGADADDVFSALQSLQRTGTGKKKDGPRRTQPRMPDSKCCKNGYAHLAGHYTLKGTFYSSSGQTTKLITGKLVMADQTDENGNADHCGKYFRTFVDQPFTNESLVGTCAFRDQGHVDCVREVSDPELVPIIGKYESITYRFDPRHMSRRTCRPKKMYSNHRIWGYGRYHKPFEPSYLGYGYDFIEAQDRKKYYKAAGQVSRMVDTQGKTYYQGPLGDSIVDETGTNFFTPNLPQNCKLNAAPVALDQQPEPAEAGAPGQCKVIVIIIDIDVKKYYKMPPPTHYFLDGQGKKYYECPDNGFFVDNTGKNYYKPIATTTATTTQATTTKATTTTTEATTQYMVERKTGTKYYKVAVPAPSYEVDTYGNTYNRVPTGEMVVDSSGKRFYSPAKPQNWETCKSFVSGEGKMFYQVHVKRQGFMEDTKRKKYFKVPGYNYMVDDMGKYFYSATGKAATTPYFMERKTRTKYYKVAVPAPSYEVDTYGNTYNRAPMGEMVVDSSGKRFYSPAKPKNWKTCKSFVSGEGKTYYQVHVKRQGFMEDTKRKKYFKVPIDDDLCFVDSWGQNYYMRHPPAPAPLYDEAPAPVYDEPVSDDGNFMVGSFELTPSED